MAGRFLDVKSKVEENCPPLAEVPIGGGGKMLFFTVIGFFDE